MFLLFRILFHEECSSIILKIYSQISSSFRQGAIIFISRDDDEREKFKMRKLNKKINYYEKFEATIYKYIFIFYLFFIPSVLILI